MARIKISELSSTKIGFYRELSDQESEMIVGGLNPQPLPPGRSIARQPEALFIVAGHQY